MTDSGHTPDETGGRPGIRITATDLAHPDDSGTVEIMDTYLLICAGTAEQTSVQVYNKADGSQTHVITVKGCKAARS